MFDRRAFFRFAAPAVVAASSLMPISAVALQSPAPTPLVSPRTRTRRFVTSDGRLLVVTENIMLREEAGRPLLASEIDANFAHLDERIRRLEDWARGG